VEKHSKRVKNYCKKADLLMKIDIAEPVKEDTDTDYGYLALCTIYDRKRFSILLRNEIRHYL